MVMRVFVAGGTGVLGRRLVPQAHQLRATGLGWQLRHPSWRQGFREELA